MILKGSQRANGANLAAHLMNTKDNEHVLVHELRGFASDNLKGAFQEVEAIARGTKCSQYLFSLSLSPPASKSVSVDEFVNTIDRVEEKLGLQGQSRAIVFHEKEGRRHAHCAWSRIDPETMTARQLSHFKAKLMDVSRNLYLDHGWKMPSGLANAAERNPTNFSLAEWQQARRQQADPRWIKQSIQDAWAKSDNTRSLSRALEERGFFLAKGDRRSFVAIDHYGEIWSLPKMLGLKTKAVRDRLGDGESLPSVADTKKLIGQKMTPAIRAHIAESRARFAERSDQLGQYKTEMTRLHREARLKFAAQQKAERESQVLALAARLPKGMRGLWHRITGKYQQMRRENAAEVQQTKTRQSEAFQAFVEKQLAQRSVLQTEFKNLRNAQAEELRGLRADVGRFLKFSRGSEQPALRASTGLSLKLTP